MTALTRWVLAHKRTVVITWVVLTIAGMAAAGPASDALEAEFSVPEQGGLGDQPGDRRALRGQGGNTAPLVPVLTLPEGKTVRSPA